MQVGLVHQMEQGWPNLILQGLPSYKTVYTNTRIRLYLYIHTNCMLGLNSLHSVHCHPKQLGAVPHRCKECLPEYTTQRKDLHGSTGRMWHLLLVIPERPL
jgi:hypothetical protein